jgi:hypothetical protein
MIRPVVLGFLLLLLTACGLIEPRVTLSTPVPTAPAVIQGGNNPTPAAESTNTTAPANTPAPPTEAPEVVNTPDSTLDTPLPLPDPELFPTPWGNRSDFTANLVSSDQGVLAEDLSVSVYHLELTISSDYRRMMGREEVLYTNRETITLNEIVFRLYPNLLGGNATVSNLRVNGGEVSPILELEDTILRVPLAQPLAPGEAVVVSMSFDVEIPDNPEGNYGSFTFLDGTLALAHAYPMIAEYTEEEGGWEAEIPAASGDIIYASSSYYRVRLTTPATAVVAASGIGVEESNDGTNRTVVYTAGPVRDFYIAMSENYVISEITVGETVVRSYTYSDPEIGEEVLEQSAASLETFNDLIGNYPFTELEVAETPNLALGIEYPGVIVLTNRLYDPTTQTSSGNLAAVRESTVAHEVGHQWFYSTVGNDQLDEPWLDESLAQYITYRYFIAQYGPQASAGFLASLEGRWSGVGERPIPVGLPVSDYTPQEYGAIVYGRGPIFFINLEEVIGLETVDAFLKAYYANHKFGIAATETLKADLEAACGCDLTSEFEEWIY